MSRDRIVTIVLAVLLVGALVFGYTRNSALSDSRATVAKQSTQISGLQADNKRLTEQLNTAQSSLDTANAQLAACSATVKDSLGIMTTLYNKNFYYYADMKTFDADALVCDPNFFPQFSEGS